ncbi:MAG: tetratricopeptide repeat protein [Thermoguttaceae bacterium]
MPYSWNYGSLVALILAILSLTAATGSSADENAEHAALRDYNAAAALQNTGLYERAGEKWATFIQTHTSDARLDRARYYLGICRLRTGKLPEAVQTFEDLLAKYPQFASADGARYNLGLALLQVAQKSKKPEDFRAAAHALADVAAKHPASKHVPESLYYEAEALVSAGDRPGAIDVYRKLIASPSAAALVADAYYALGTTQQELGRDTEAVATFQSFLDKEASSAHDLAKEIRLRLAISLYNQKKYAEAEKHFAAVAILAGFPLADFAMLRQGECQWQAGKLAEAAAVLAELPKRFPASSYKAEAQLAAGKCYFRADKPIQARHVLESLADGTLREAAEAAYWLGTIAGREKQFDEAIRRHKQCLEKSPPAEFAAPASCALAEAYLAKQNYAEAIPALEKVLAGHPEPSLARRARYLRGLSYQRQKQFEPAAKDLEAFLSTRPTVDEAADARYALALCQIELKRYAQAWATIGELLQEKADYPNSDRLYYELGHACLEGPKRSEATRAFQSLAEKFPNSSLAAESWFHVGHAHEDASDRATGEAQKKAEAAKAAEAYAAGLSKAGSSGLREKLQYKLADMQFRQGQFDRAATTLLAQIQEYPQGKLAGPARFLAAESLYRQEKFDDARPLFARVAAEKVAPYEALAIYRAGTCAANQKRWAESQKHFEAIVKDFPKFEQIHEARYGLALALQNQQQYAPARSLYEQVAKTTETETAAKARFMLGEMAFAEDKYEDAIEQYLMVTSGYPYKQWRASAQFEIGRCFFAMGNRDQAIAALKVVTEKYPDHPKAKEAKKLLDEWTPNPRRAS